MLTGLTKGGRGGQGNATMADKWGIGGQDPPFLADIICEQPLMEMCDMAKNIIYNMHKYTVFAIAKIQRIGHDHQASFFLGIIRIKRDTKPTQAATCWHMINLAWTPNIFQILNPP